MTQSDEQPCDGSQTINRRNLREAVATRVNRTMVASSAKRLLRVLVIDDDRDAAEGVARLAQFWGHVARQAYSAHEALESAIAFRPDVLLLDIAMPFADGCEIARELRRDTRLQGCFIVALTGYGDDQQRLRCRAAGIDLLLVKPVDRIVLETLLELEGDYVKRAPGE